MLGFLGFKRKYTFGKTAGWSNGKTLFWIGEADAEGKKHKHRIGNIGFHHYAFELGSRRDVDDLYEVLSSTRSMSSTRRPTIPTTARATTPCSSPIPTASSSRAWCSSRRARRKREADAAKRRS